MQRLMGVNLTVNSRGIATNNKSIMTINELLSQGWKVANLVCANENSNGMIGGFVVLEKEDKE